MTDHDILLLALGAYLGFLLTLAGWLAFQIHDDRRARKHLAAAEQKLAAHLAAESQRKARV